MRSCSWLQLEMLSVTPSVAVGLIHTALSHTTVHFGTSSHVRFALCYCGHVRRLISSTAPWPFSRERIGYTVCLWWFRKQKRFLCVESYQSGMGHVITGSLLMKNIIIIVIWCKNLIIQDQIKLYRFLSASAFDPSLSIMSDVLWSGMSWPTYLTETEG